MEYSVVIPVYNSEGSLGEIYARIRIALEKITPNFEVIFVDDFSADNSWKTLLRIKEKNPNHVRLIRFAKNYGQNNATMCGLRHSKGDYIVTLDDDLQHNPEDIPLLISTLKEKEVDLVYGIPENYEHKSGYRKYAGRIWKFGARNFGDAYGEGSSFRVIKKEIVEKIIQHGQYFVFIDEMLSWYTDVNAFVKVPYNRNAATDKSGYSGLKLILLGINLIVFYTSIPLKMMTYGGLAMSFISFLLGLKFIYKKIAIGVPVQGYTSLMVVILFSTSLLLICFGIIGQYLGKIYTVLNKKPIYSIREKML